MRMCLSDFSLQACHRQVQQWEQMAVSCLKVLTLQPRFVSCPQRYGTSLDVNNQSHQWPDAELKLGNSSDQGKLFANWPE